MIRQSFVYLLFALGGLICSRQLVAQDASEGEFFERKIRPVLVAHCYQCHSEEARRNKKLRGGLRVDTREGLRVGGDSGPATVPNDPGRSLLLSALRYDDNDLKMPPSKKLPDAVIADFERWVKMGAPDPRDIEPAAALRQSSSLAEAGKFWAFVPPKKTTPPAVEDTGWPASDVDRFVMARLEANGLRPAREADRDTLLRRASYALTGLPPTAQDVDDFLADNSPDAFARVVDRLLRSPHFGIHLGRYWLDNVRFTSDDPRCGAAGVDNTNSDAYREWVVRAFNDDLPYDQFLTLQIAGDQVPAKDPEGIHADGLTATGIWALANIPSDNEPEKLLAEVVDQQIDVVGRTFLGLTLACARCHDHKFDPITQQDYYALAGIFHSSHVYTGTGRNISRVLLPVVYTTEEETRYEQAQVRLKELAGLIVKIEHPNHKASELHRTRRELAAQRARRPADDGEAQQIQRKINELQKREKAMLDDQAKEGWEPTLPQADEYEKLLTEREQLDQYIQATPLRMVIREGPLPGLERFPAIGDMKVYIRGDHNREGELVPRGFPKVLTWRAEPPLSERTKASGRLELAQWLTDPQHPLTARVMVNRVWQHLFGTGLVRTPSNFGKLGEPPSHPELLDTLAVELIESGWSVKELIRKIMFSKTYQQACLATPRSVEHDPENRLLSRMNRRRLAAEDLRDTLLLLGGKATRDVPTAELSNSGRTFFLKVSRGGIEPLVSLFDGADPRELVARRGEATSAPQALYLLNNSEVLEIARSVSERLFKQHSEEADRIDAAYRLFYSRSATAAEKELGQELLDKTRKTMAGPRDNPVRYESRAWTDFCHVLICGNEFLYVE